MTQLKNDLYRKSTGFNASVKQFCKWSVLILAGLTATRCEAATWQSPVALVATDRTLFIACSSANQVMQLDPSNHVVVAIRLPLPPSGLALSADGAKLFVTCAAPESKVCIVDVRRQKVIGSLSVGHSATAPVLSLDNQILYACNQFGNDVSIVDLKTKKELCRIPVRREPVAADITQNGKYLLVANQLPAGRADGDTLSAVVSVIDLSTRRVVKELVLPNGSGELKDIKVSPDGRSAAVTHLVASFTRLTTTVRSGWMNANALTVVDLNRMEITSSVLLDEPNRGAANPWGVAWSDDGKTLAVAHAGTHEVSLIDFPALLSGLSTAVDNPQATKKNIPILKHVSHYEGLDEGLPFLVGARKRISLPTGDLGPRSLAFLGTKLYVGNYFSDTLSVIDTAATNLQVESAALDGRKPMDKVRQGEFYFHDATICQQGWQSCSSCHPGNGRVDGFNWDLLNDGVGNPKSTRSLLLAHQTPPAMFLGVRTNAETAVRAGIKFILFTNLAESVSQSMDEYLKSLQPVPSPYLINNKLSKLALRGEKLFQRAGCVDCHPPGVFTDLKPHDVGTRRAFDDPDDRFYTPTLIEVWRTAPYLHDGSAPTIRDVIVTRNPNGEHGDVDGLSNQELDELCEYVLSL